MRHIFRIATYVLGFCSLSVVPAWGGESSGFIKAIESAKQFVVPIVCFGKNPDTKEPFLISVEGTGFFVTGDRRVITAGHAARSISAQQRIPSCAIPAIYLPTEGWDSSKPSVAIRYIPIGPCIAGDTLDIGACDLSEDLATDSSLKVRPKASELDGTIYPDGTPVAFTGFPLSFVQPITSQGIIGTYRGPNVTLGPTELVIDKNAWPGASGSPVYGVDGKVLGIVVQRGFSDASGLAFAIPGRAIMKFLADNPIGKEQKQTAPAQDQKH